MGQWWKVMSDSGWRGGAPNIASFSGVILSGERGGQVWQLPAAWDWAIFFINVTGGSGWGYSWEFLFVNFCRIQPVVPLFKKFLPRCKTPQKIHHKTSNERTNAAAGAEVRSKRTPSRIVLVLVHHTRYMRFAWLAVSHLWR